MSLAVIVAAGGAAWESAVLAEIEASDTLHLARRCLDLAEVLALSELCDVAVVATDLMGLGADSVHALQADRVRVIGVGDAEYAHRLGVDAVASPGGLAAAVATVSVDDAREARVAPTSIVAVWGPHGAPGRSVIAASVAAALAASGRGTVLVDADSRGGCVGQMFALLDDVSGLVAACRSVNRGRPDELPDHLVAVADGLSVLTGVPRSDMWSQVRRPAFDRVLTQLADHAHVVVDTGPGLDDHTRAVLQLASSVVVVGRADPVGLARLVRAVHDVRELRVTDPIVLVNQLRATSSWSARDVSGAVARLAGVAPDVIVDADYRLIDSAAIRGVAAVDVGPNSAFAASIGRVVDRLVPVRSVRG